ncbi:MAG: NAD-dependent epimerase/dehydratase family protein [Armatimonadetes bacterium]|nr:NAD-dependent epimerase/dehydratase family protein [Armatimonadota bacterium]
MPAAENAAQPIRKVFVTGGSGFLGINLVRHLLDKGCEVVSFDIAPFDYPEKDRVRSIEGDIRDLDRVREAMAGCDAVVHSAAALPLYSREDIFSTDVDGTGNVLEAASQEGVRRVVFVSSTAVYGVPDHHPIYEDDPKVGVGPYGEAKIRAEEVCLRYRERGMCVPIVRPKSFIGPERLGVFALFYDWAKDGRGFPLLGNGRNRYQLLDVEDLCDAIWICLTGPDETVNDVFNIGAREFTTMREDFQAVLDRAGFGKKIKCIPAGPAVAVLKVLEKLKLSPLYCWVYETASTDSFVSTEKAEKVLGFVPRYSNKDALIRNYEWYLANLSSFEGQSGVSHRVPWKQGILSLAKRFF